MYEQIQKIIWRDNNSCRITSDYYCYSHSLDNDTELLNMNYKIWPWSHGLNPHCFMPLYIFLIITLTISNYRGAFTYILSIKCFHWLSFGFLSSEHSTFVVHTKVKTESDLEIINHIFRAVFWFYRVFNVFILIEIED